MDKEKIIEKYKESLTNGDKAYNTIKTYIRNVKFFLKWLEDRYNETNPIGVTVLDVKEYQEYLINVKKYKASGIKQRMESVKSYCEFLYEKKYIEKKLISNVKIIKSNDEEIAPKIISKNNMNKFRREVYKGNNLRDIAIIETLLGTGIRVNELINLNIDDISIFEKKGNVIIRKGKGKKFRELPLNKDVRNALRNYLEVRPMDYDNSLWIGQRGPLTQDGINKMLKRYARKVNLEDEVHPHMFRHYLARQLLRIKKHDPILVAHILGHSNINTLKIYTKPTQEEIENTLEDVYY